MALTLQEKRERKAERQYQRVRMQAANCIARNALSLNKCPDCGGSVHRNLALTGWVQCDGFGADGFRKDPNAKPCQWQGFTGE